MLVYSLRCSLAELLFCLFGYLAPALNSIKAVVSEDTDGIKEFLTYWVVLSITTALFYLLTFLRLVQLPNMPEVKVVCVLWLTLPKFQGAYRIYVLLLKWSYDRYESEIDDQVSVLSHKLRSTMWSKLKVMLFVLFFSNNDSLMQGVGSFGSTDLLSSLSDFATRTWGLSPTQADPHKPHGGSVGGSKGGDNENLSGSQPASSPQPGRGSSFWESPDDKRSAKERFRVRMLAEFTSLLREGVFIQSCLVLSDEVYVGGSSVVVNKLKLQGDSLYLQSTEQDTPRTSPSQAGGEGKGGEGKGGEGKEDSKKNDPEPRGLRMLLSSLTCVERHHDPQCPAEDIVLLRSACSPGCFNALYLHAEDSSEADMLLHGFRQMLQSLQRHRKE